MKYKNGDKVIIKTWEEMKEEFGSHLNRDHEEVLDVKNQFVYKMENVLNKKRIVTILEIRHTQIYWIEEDNNDHKSWNDDMIKCLAKEYEEPEPVIIEQIENRFEILDL